MGRQRRCDAWASAATRELTAVRLSPCPVAVPGPLAGPFFFSNQSFSLAIENTKPPPRLAVTLDNPKGIRASATKGSALELGTPRVGFSDAAHQPVPDTFPDPAAHLNGRFRVGGTTGTRQGRRQRRTGATGFATPS